MSGAAPSDVHTLVNSATPVTDGKIERGRIAYLDGWRGLAIIMVLSGHFGSSYWQPMQEMARFGVDLFFVLSGRLMADILFISRQPLPLFFRRRISRIYPALIVYASTMGLISLADYAFRQHSLMAPWEYLTAITFTINYVQALTGRGSLLLDHLWSLSVEEHCYVLLAVLSVVVTRRTETAKWVIGGVGVLGLLNGLRLAEVGNGGVHDVYWRTDVRLAPAFLSASLFLWLESSKRLDRQRKRFLGLIAVPCLVLTAALFFQPSVWIKYTSSAFLLSIAVNAIDFSPLWVRALFSLRPLTTFGLLSYSTYLWQQPVFRKLVFLPVFARVVVAIALGLASFFIVEQPARRWINTRGERGWFRRSPR